MFSGSLKSSRKVVREAGMDPDEIFWWIETNLLSSVSDPSSLADALDTLAKADHFRSVVMKRQNWRFKAYMIDLMSGVSLFRNERDRDNQGHGFTPFRPPDRIMMSISGMSQAAK